MGKNTCTSKLLWFLNISRQFSLFCHLNQNRLSLTMPKSNNQKKAEAEAAGRPPKKTKQQENAESPRPRKRKSRKLPRLRKTRRNPSTIRNCMSTTAAYSTKRVDHFSFLKNPHAQNSKFKMFLEEE